MGRLIFPVSSSSFLFPNPLLWNQNEIGAIRDAMLECSLITPYYALANVLTLMRPLPLAKITPRYFFFFFRKIDKQNHCAVFSGGHCAWRTSFYNSTSCQTLHIKIATEYGVSFLASTSYHTSFKCCSGNLEPWILLSRTQTMFMNCSMCQLCLYANWEYMVLNLSVQLSWLGRLHFENYFEITE